jgi:hypothetical protein
MPAPILPELEPSATPKYERLLSDARKQPANIFPFPVAEPAPEVVPEVAAMEPPALSEPPPAVEVQEPPAETVLPFPDPDIAPRLTWRRVVALPAPVPFDLLSVQTALLRDILDTNLPGGIAGPLVYDTPVTSGFDLQILPIDETHIEIAFSAAPDRGVTLADLRAAFETTLAGVAATGIPPDTHARVRARFTTNWPDWSDSEETARWMAGYATDRLSTLRTPLTEADLRALDAQLRPADLDALLTALAGPGRTAIALLGKDTPA